MKKILFILNPETSFKDYIVPIISNKGSLYDSFERVDSIDWAIDLMRKNPKDYSLIIMEVSMRSLGIFSLDETMRNRITGIVLFEAEFYKLEIPIIFWSKSRDQQKYVSMLKRRRRYKDHNLSFLHKTKEEDDYLNLLRKIRKVFEE